MHLVILDSEIRSLLSLLMCYLHEKPAHKCAAYVLVELVLILSRNQRELVPLHDALELCADVVCLREGTCGEVV